MNQIHRTGYWIVS